MVSFSICEHCERPFSTQQGLQNHQSRKDSDHLACHRLQQNKRKIAERESLIDRRDLISKTRFVKSMPDVSVGPHQSGSPIQENEKRCILNLFQSFVNDGLSTREARIETANRLLFSERSVSNVVKEKIAIGNVSSNNSSRKTPNAYEKLAEEEIEEIRKMVRMIECRMAKIP